MDGLVLRYHGKLLDFALRHLRDREASADVAQACLVKVYQVAGSYQGRSSFRTWLYAIALNLIRDEARKRKRRGESLASEMADEGSSEHEWAAGDDSAEDVALGRIESIALWSAVGDLPEQHSSAVILRFRLGLTHDEIAEAMGAPSGTVKSWLHYALKSLRKSLASEDQI